MARYIASKIMQDRQTSLAAGQAKYRAYFVTHSLYKNYKESVDAILTANNCADCIVT